jgi:c-di-GMP-binding flagellar brake protein YcgR
MKQNGVNRRRFIRIDFPFTIHISPSEEEAVSTYTEDISEGGVKVFIAEKLKTSSIVILAIYLKPKPIVCKGKVVWAKKRVSDFIEGEVFFDTGIEFYEIKEEDKLLIQDRVAELEKEKESGEEAQQ